MSIDGRIEKTATGVGLLAAILSKSDSAYAIGPYTLQQRETREMVGVSPQDLAKHAL